jgi:phage tail sheath gpL-like
LAPAASQTITLDEIPYNLEVPGVFYQIRANYSQAGLLPYPAKALLIGQMLASGTAQADTPYQVFAAADAQALGGAGSIIAQMAAAFIKANPWIPLEIIGVADASGATKASGTFAITGTATAAGTLALYVQGIRIAVPVAVGDTAANVATNALATIDQLESSLGGIPFSAGALPFSASVTTGTLTITALHGGTLGNTIDLRTNAMRGDQTPPGITVAVTAMAGGATDPDITNAMDAIASTWFTDIGICWNDAPNVGIFESTLATRYMAMGKLDAKGYRVIAGTPATVQTAQTGLNSKYATTMPIQNPMQPTWVICGSFAGACSYALAQDPSRQLRGVALPGIIAPAAADQYDETERNILLAAGMTTFTVAVDGTVQLERVVTENVTDSNGIPTEAWHDIMVPATMSRIRYDWIGYVSLVYPRNKLAPDGSLAAEYDGTVVTPKRMRGAWAGRCRVYAEAGWIVNVAQTVNASTFVIDSNNPNRMNSRQQVNLIGNLMILAGDLEFSAAA